MTIEPDNDIEQRAMTITAMLLLYAGIFLTDREECLAIMAQDENLAALVPSDVQLAFMMVIDLFAAAADLDADDVRVLVSAVIGQSAEQL